MRPINLRDRILYTQVLTQADYVVHALTAIVVLPGGSIVHGAFERDGQTVESLHVNTYSEVWTVGEQRYSVTVLAGGLFTLTPV